jgi:hypothetical protein
MRILNFLYYILYRTFYQYSAKKEMMPNGTSLLLTMLLSTNIIMIIFPLKFIIPKGTLIPFPYNLIVRIILLSVFVINRYAFKSYFVKKENYVWIIDKYDSKYKDKIKWIKIIGFLYTILTPISFIVLAIIISG